MKILKGKNKLFKFRVQFPSGLKIIFRSFQYRNYRLFFSGQSVSLIGTWIQRIATPWLVYHLTGSVFLLGVVGFVGQIPTFLIAPFAGVMTDRWNKYQLLIATQVAAMIQALILAALYFSGKIQVWQIVMLNAFLGCVNAFDVPVRQSFVIQMVGRKEDLGNAIALNSLMVNGARLIGPTIAGMLIAFAGEGICYLLNGISYIFVIVSLLMMKVAPVEIIKKNNPRIFREMKEGFVYTFSNPPLKSIILLLAVVSLMGMQYSVLMPVFAKEILHGGSHTFGFLMGATGLGAFIGAFYLASRKDAVGLSKMIPVAAAVFGIGLIAFSFSYFLTVSLILMTVVGFGWMLQIAASNTVLQTIVDDDKRGRVMSLYTMAFMGSAPFGSFLAGWTATLIGVKITYMIGGFACILGATLYLRGIRGIKKLIRPLYVKLGFIPPEISSGIQSATDLSTPPEE